MNDVCKTPAGRLTEQGVRAIKADRASGMTYQEIAARYGVSLGTVYNIAKGRTWAWLSSEPEPVNG